MSEGNTMKRIAYIFGAGEPSVPDTIPPRDDILVIAADGGYTVACRAFGRPDLAVGDFDSLGYLPSDTECLRHPPEKDDTDLALAANIAIERGAEEIRIYSALGGRLDHTVANLQLLYSLALRGVRATLFGADGVAITVLVGGECATLAPAKEGTVSVLAIGGTAEGVTLTGLKYPLADATLYPHTPLGISNERMGTAASISLLRGAILVFYPAKGDNALAVSKIM